MNKENAYCWNRGYNFKTTSCKDCETILAPCYECGMLCVFESDKQPAKGCPQRFDKGFKHEYNVCLMCDQRFCDVCMGSIDTCKNCEPQR